DHNASTAGVTRRFEMKEERVTTPAARPPRLAPLRAFESLSAAVGIASLAAYILGLAVIAVHDSQFHIAALSVLRTQAVCAGASLCGLCALSATVSLRILPTFAQLERRKGEVLTLRAQLRDAGRIARLYNLLAFCTLNVLWIIPLPHGIGWFWTRWTILCVALPVVIVAGVRIKTAGPICQVAEIIEAALFALFFFRFAPKPLFAATAWLAAAGAEVAWLRRAFAIAESPLDLNWFKGTGYALALVIWFALFIYGSIPATFGGGAPRVADVYFAPGSPFGTMGQPKQ